MCLKMVKRMTVMVEELWTFLIRPDLMAHLKSEAFADDLISRHMDAGLLLEHNFQSLLSASIEDYNTEMFCWASKNNQGGEAHKPQEEGLLHKVQS